MILVTGGTGLVGSHLLYQLCLQGKKVRVACRTSSKKDLVKRVFDYYSDRAEELFQQIEWIQMDMLEYEEVSEAMEGVSYVYHCAAWVSFNRSDRSRMMKNNVEGTANIVNACLEKGIAKLCFVSSTAATGTATQGEMVVESMKWKPSSHHSVYSVSKFRSEMEVWRGIEEGLKAVIVNPSVIFGPGEWEKGSSSFFSHIWKGMPFYTEGVTGYVDVRDVTEIMIRLMESDISGERFIVSSENLSYRDVFTQIAKALGKKAPQWHATPFLSHMGLFFASFFAILTGKSMAITRETISAAHSKVFFSNDKIRNILSYTFISMNKSIEDTARLFMKDLKSS